MMIDMITMEDVFDKWPLDMTPLTDEYDESVFE